MTENLPGDDVEGYAARIGRADTERDETEDVEGHAFRKAADAERDETDDDVRGHVGHLGGPFDPKR
ncbi:hypothetical protein [Actinomycetospora sp. CA-084318]|uniref:hypothetical protein n=1 Tax=Actinomycetospora sp. CA-084318 TaxID=3239892 RepID=UPI003D979890